MTRARVKALHDQVNSLLTMIDLDSTLDGMLPHADMLCVLRYIPQEDSLMDQDDKPKQGAEEEKEAVPGAPVLPVPLPPVCVGWAEAHVTDYQNFQLFTSLPLGHGYISLFALWPIYSAPSPHVNPRHKHR